MLKGCDTESEESDWVVNEIARIIKEGFESQDICVVGRTRTEAERIGKALSNQGIESRTISRDSGDDQSVPSIRLANMHRVKGLEFKVVFLVGIRDGKVPLEISMKGTEDPVERRNREINERALLHVAGTRAAQSLYITWSDKPSRMLATLKGA